MARVLTRTACGLTLLALTLSAGVGCNKASSAKVPYERKPEEKPSVPAEAETPRTRIVNLMIRESELRLRLDAARTPEEKTAILTEIEAVTQERLNIFTTISKE